MRALGESDALEIGPYRLLVELSADELGRVLLGTAEDGRLVALTLVDDGLVDDLFRARLRSEIAAGVPGTRIVHVVDGDADASTPWVATGFIPRVSLRAATAQSGPLPTSSLLRLADGLAEALEELHDKGRVHGHLTPDTVLLTDIGPLLVDSGIARATGRHSTADDIRALGALVAEAGGADLDEPVRQVVETCSSGDVSPAELRSVIGALPRSELPWPPAVRELAAEESDRIVGLITETGWRPAQVAAGPAPEPVDLTPPGRLTRFFDGVLVTAVTLFVSWLISYLMFDDAPHAPVPDHATLVAQGGSFAAGATWLLWPCIGFAFAVFCTWLVLLVARPRTTTVPWTVLVGLSLVPVGLWGVTFTGLDVALVAVPTHPDLYEGAFIPAVVAGFLGYWVAHRLFGDNRPKAAGALAFVSLAAVGLAVTIGLYFGWYGVVIADVVRLDVAGVPAGCVAGSVVARTLSPNRVM
jgi:hypothetical protein